MIYVCDSCHFVFERSGEVEQCPVCGKMIIHYANEEQINEYRMINAELKLNEEAIANKK